MKKYAKIVLLGFITWLIPFIIAFFFYSREGELIIDIFLFKSIMIVIGAISGASLLVVYFKKVKEDYFHEGIRVGLIWLAINLILDIIILLNISKMAIGSYFSEIGLRYLIIPTMSIAIGYLLEQSKDK